MPFEKLERLFLVVPALTLPLIALAYGFAHELKIGSLFDIDTAPLHTRNILRATMGIYLAVSGLWMAGFLTPALRRPALWCLTLFMSGVGMGRILSMLLDGWPHPVFVLFAILEVVMAIAGWLIITRDGQTA